MSFKRNEEQSVISKRFVSENELEEIKRKRNEEWELARKQGRAIEKEEDAVHDGRTLYERLKEQKDKKQEEFEEQLKFKNMIYKGLDKEDASFLSEVSSKQAEFHSRRFDSDNFELKSYRAAVETMRTEEDSKPTTSGSYKNPRVNKPLKVEAKPKMTSVIIRKRQSNAEKVDESKAKQAKNDATSKHEDKTTDNNQQTEFNESKVKVVTAPASLQGLIAYSDSNDESEED